MKETTKKSLWEIIQPIVIAIVCISPFWFMASSVNADEYEKTGLAAVMAAAVTIVLKLIRS